MRYESAVDYCLLEGYLSVAICGVNNISVQPVVLMIEKTMIREK